MALVLNDRVKETSTTTGQGTLSLGGAATGFETFVTGIGNSNTTYYLAAHESDGTWELGIGTVTDASPDTLARTTVIDTSAGNTTKIDFASGNKTIFCTLPAGKAVFLDADGDVTLGANLSVGGNLDVTGTFDLSDSNFTNAGNIQLDSISGDADTNTSITFSGSDVITMATGGTSALTIDASQNVTVAGDLTVSGDDITMGTNTAGNLLIADGTNFNSIAAGSLSEISSVANDDVFLAVDTSGGGLKKITRSAIVAGLATSSAISNVSEDSTPQLGGSLDVNGEDIVSVSNGNITLTPNGTGVVRLDGNVDIQSGLIDLKNAGAVSKIKFYCESSNAHAQIVQGAPHSESASNTLTLPSTGGDARLVSTASTATLTNKTLTSPKINEDVAVTSTATELNLLDGITAGTVSASLAVIADSNKDISGFRNVTLTGELDAATLDISGNADIDGTTNLDAVDIDGAVQIDSTVTVGVDDTGYDFKLFGATSGSFLLWDESDDALELTDSTPIKIGDGGDMTIYHDGSHSYVTNATGTLKLATETSGIAVTIGHTTSEVTVGDNLTVTGDLTVSGTTTTVNSTTVNLNDHNIVLDSGNSTSAVINGAGITIEGGSGSDATFTYSTTGPKFELKLGSNHEDLQVDQLIAASLDISGDVDVDGTLEADAITVNGTTLAEFISDTTGAMVSSNTETGITVTYQDGDNTIDFALAAAQTTITSLLATDIKIGEDDQTKIDFETADEIHFYAANVEQVYLGDNIFGPQSDSDVDLGSSSVRWKDAYIDSITVTGEVTMATLDIGGTNVTSTAAELNIMDGGTSATSTTLADADRVVVNDNGTMKQVAMTDISTYTDGGATALAIALG
jgi:cytoskeletal protein CcmA (bactofilin family)